MTGRVTVGSAATHYSCDDCAQTYDLTERVTVCPACGGLLEVEYDLAQATGLAEQAAAGSGMWRWRSLLPLPTGAETLSLGEGDSPLLRLSATAGGTGELLVKNDGLMPTGSFKDRGFALAVAFARHLGERSGFTYSSGNAGASFAAYCARAGIRATVLVEAAANDAKVALISMHAAAVHRLDYDTSDEVFAAIKTLAQQGHYTYVNFINPIRHEAMKVTAYEICEALDWRAPDVVAHPVGTGGGLWGAWKGFRELYALGLIDRLPRMIGVQPAACAPLAEAFGAGREATIRTGDASATIAQSIAGDAMIHSGRRVLRAIRDSGGTAVAVEEEEIAASMRALGATGISAEPSAAVSHAALASVHRAGWLDPGARAVAVVTGTGLKQPTTLQQIAPPTIGRVRADATELSTILTRRAP